MSKAKFLKELESKLKILNEKERQDIITEYKSIIEEKVKNGQTEKEAVADFGDINELVNEILDAYKINTNYSNKTSDDKIKDFADKSEEVIKEGASKLASFSKKVVSDISNNDTLSIEMVFEIMIKAFLLLFGFLILKVPFMIVKEIGIEILDITFSPLSNVLIFIWGMIVGFLYIISCILIAIIVFKKYFNINYKKSEVKEVKKQESVTEVKQETKLKEESVKNNDNTLVKVLWMIFKVFIIITFYVPLLFATMGLIIALSFIFYLIFKGLNLIGVLMIIMGLVLIFAYLSHAVYRIIINKAISKVYPLIVAIPLIIIGGLFSFDKMMDITYYNEKPPYQYNMETKVYYENVIDGANIYNDTYGKINHLIDDTLKDNEIKIEVSYYNELIDLSLDKYNSKNIRIDGNLKGIKLKKLMNLVIDDLKEEKIYNYGKLLSVDVNIYANSNTKINIVERVD